MKNEENNWVPWDLHISSLERNEMRVLGKKEVITLLEMWFIIRKL